MQYRMSLKDLISLVTCAAISMMLLMFAIRNQQHDLLITLLLILSIPLTALVLYALSFLLLLPVGLLNRIYVSEKEVAQSPFASDRLPERVVYTDEDGR